MDVSIFRLSRLWFAPFKQMIWIPQLIFTFQLMSDQRFQHVFPSSAVFDSFPLMYSILMIYNENGMSVTFSKLQ